MRSILLFVLCGFACILAKAQYKVHVTHAVPLQTAVSGHYAGANNGELRTWGGCNFPDKPLAEGGKKRFYPVAYGVSIPVSQGTVCVGGTPDDVFSATEVMMERNVTYRDNGISQWQFDHGTRAYVPSLPKGLHNMGGAYWDGYIYVLAGQTDSLPNHDVFRLEWPDGKAWEKVSEMPGDPRLQPVVAVQHNASGVGLYVFGGFSPKKENSKGYVHTDGLCMDLKSKKWKKLQWPEVSAEFLPTVGACVRTEGVATIMVLGGVNAEIFNAAINHPALSETDYFRHQPEWYKFQSDMLVYNTYTDSWNVVPGSPELARAGATWTKVGNFWFLAGGEVKPGIRTNDVSCVEVIKASGFYRIGLLALCVIALCFVALYCGLCRVGGKYLCKKEPAAWLSVLSMSCAGPFFWVVPTFFFMHEGLLSHLWIGGLYMFAVVTSIDWRRADVDLHASGYVNKGFALCRLAAWLLVPSWLLAQATVWPMWVYVLIMAFVSASLFFCGKGKSFVWADVLQMIFMLAAVAIVACLAFCGPQSLPDGILLMRTEYHRWGLVMLVLYALLNPFFLSPWMPRVTGKAGILNRLAGAGALSLLFSLVMAVSMFVCIHSAAIQPDFSLKSVYAVLPSFFASVPNPWLSGFLMATLMSASWCAVTHQLRRLL